jgi:uncharacterized metal-binding protein
MDGNVKMEGQCAGCSGNFCSPVFKADDRLPDIEKFPRNCSRRNSAAEIARAHIEYLKDGVNEFACLSWVQEAERNKGRIGGPGRNRTRIEEIVQLSKKCSYVKLGVAFCDELTREAGNICDIFQNNGFSVYSICCKVGRLPINHPGLREHEKTASGRFDPACNPIAQAMILNRTEVDMVVMVGLCVGHDTLFIQYCEKPVTILAVKDRLLAHNPLAAVYLSKNPFYARLMHAE